MQILRSPAASVGNAENSETTVTETPLSQGILVAKSSPACPAPGTCYELAHQGLRKSGVQDVVVEPRVVRVTRVPLVATAQTGLAQAFALHSLDNRASLLVLSGPPLFSCERSANFRVRFLLLLDEGDELTLSIIPGMLFLEYSPRYEPLPGGHPPLPRKWQVAFLSLLNITIQRTFVRIWPFFRYSLVSAFHHAASYS